MGKRKRGRRNLLPAVRCSEESMFLCWSQAAIGFKPWESSLQRAHHVWTICCSSWSLDPDETISCVFSKTIICSSISPLNLVCTDVHLDLIFVFDNFGFTSSQFDFSFSRYHFLCSKTDTPRRLFRYFSAILIIILCKIRFSDYNFLY